MFLTKEQLQEAEIDYEQVRKFAELFPSGTEVTRELCMKHPDVFSFGLPGSLLLPTHARRAYRDRILLIAFHNRLRNELSKARIQMNSRMKKPRESVVKACEEKLAYSGKACCWQKAITFYDASKT
jgi:hypothetical protein